MSTTERETTNERVRSLPGTQRQSPWRSAIIKTGPWWTLGILVILVATFGLLNPLFLTRQSWLATSQYAVEFLLLGIGQTFVIITAGIDLSVGATLGTSAMAGAVVMRDMNRAGASPVATILVGLVVTLVAGTAIGLLNGSLITKSKLPPFIVTLGTLTAFGGGAIYLLNDGSPIADLPQEISPIGSTVIVGWLPVPVLIAGVLAVVFGLVLARTRFGLRTYAIGSDQTAARRAGINVDRHLVMVYAFAGLMAAVAGFIVTARFNNASPMAGQNDELYAIASAVIGGASLFGGRGSILGTVAGAFTIAVLTTGLVILGMQPFWQAVAIGFVIIGSVAADQARARIGEG